jgi:hypothetical protein
MNKNSRAPHPIATLTGLTSLLTDEATLLYYPLPGHESRWESAKISLLPNDVLTFTLKDADADRVIGAVFDGNGGVLSMECSTGLPNGTTMEVATMFCDQLKGALQEMSLLQ